MNILDKAKDPKTSPEELDKLSKHNVFNITYNVAGNPNAPCFVLETLSKDEEW